MKQLNQYINESTPKGAGYLIDEFRTYFDHHGLSKALMVIDKVLYQYRDGQGERETKLLNSLIEQIEKFYDN